MTWDERLMNEVRTGASPDGWNNRWMQVPPRFGGGNAVELEVGELLNAIVRATKPATVVETGTHKGFSTLMIAHALKRNNHGHLHTVDIADYGAAVECERFGLTPWVTFLKSDSATAIRDLGARLGRIDFLWLDADHGTEFVLNEVEAALPALKQGSLLAFHDTTSDPREGVAVRRLRERFKDWEAMNFVTARGFALMRVP